MTTVIPSTRRHRHALLLTWLPLWLIGCLCLVTSSGCRGCLRDDSEQLSREEMEKKAREQKEALEAKPLRTLPADSDISITLAKAGHWVETVRQFKSNREDLQVINQLGIHARPAQHIVKVAARYKAELWLEKEGNRVNGKSIMGVLLLEAESGSPVTVEVDGPDEQQLLADLRQLFLDRFHED